jgi:hypothetical protein
MRILIRAAALTCVVGLLAGTTMAVPAQDSSGQQPAQDPPSKQPTPQPPGPPPQYAAMGQQLIKGLKETPGCLGVELAFTASGKSVIFAWFRDKKACLNWYYSDTHQKMMKAYVGGTSSKPLKDVPDDCGPIMAIASITFSSEPKFKEIKMPISQISIELYTPLTGGLDLGGKFAPAGVTAPKKAKDDAPKK